MRDDFCVFIFSYDRAGNIKTLETLERHGYTGDWYIVIDHPDDKEPYYEEYGEDRVIYFSKEELIGEIDRGDNLDRRIGLVYGRNKIFDIAEDLGYKYFIQLDDDYKHFQWRFNEDLEYEYNPVEDLDNLFKNMVEYMEETKIDSLALAQGGDFIGGKFNDKAEKIKTKRKAMNSWLCCTDRKFPFMGMMNDDVNAYVRNAQLGRIFLTTFIASIDQPNTQSEEGGMTDAYLDSGTYVKTFYTILYSPSSVKISKIGEYTRIHHKILWKYTVPKIIPEEYKKGEN